MVLIAFTSKPKRQSVDATFIIKYLQDTCRRFLSLKKNKVSLKELHLQMDNARPHTAAQTKQFLEGRGGTIGQTVTLFPDLNLLDRFMFRHMKLDVRGEEFDGPEELSKAIQRSTRHISENFLA